MEHCPCGAEKPFSECCAPLIAGERKAQTAEQLMRSRYSAYATGSIDHVVNSTSVKQREGLDKEATLAWSKNSDWRGLEIVKCEKGGPEDEDGTVEFIASYGDSEGLKRHHEVGIFRKEQGSWYYQDGEMVKPKPIVRDAPKVGRNDPCSCGSGKKYKKCCALTPKG